METITIIRKKNCKEQIKTDTELLYSNATIAFNALKDAQKELKSASIKGLKEILNKIPKKEYNLIDNGIFIASYVDEFDYNTIMIKSVFIKDDIIYIATDNDSTDNEKFIDCNILYAIYSSIYVKYITNKL